MDNSTLEKFSTLLQSDPEAAKQFIIDEKRRFLAAYQKALQEKEIAWLEAQINANHI